MKTFFTRTASALVFAVLMVGGILWNQYSFGVVMLFILLGSINEYYNITEGKREKSGAKWLLLILSALLYVKSFILTSPPALGTPNTDNLLFAFLGGLLRLRDSSLALTAGIPVLLFILFAYELFTKSENPFSNIGWNVIAVVWIVIPMVLTNKLYFERGGFFLMAIFALIWLYDASSYVVGSVVGKKPLFPRISPKKTIEGMIGGVIFTVAGALIINKIPHLGIYSTKEWVALALIIVITATFGDLIESLLKRSLAIKDSGSIMPGHGGFLDRFDAYFFTVPFIIGAVWFIDQLRNMLLILEYLNS